MHVRGAAILALTLATLGGAASAQPQTTAQTLAQWGLLGTWALDCQMAPYDGEGTHMTYVAAPDGSVRAERDSGAVRATDSVPVSAARVMLSGELEIVTGPAERRWVMVLTRNAEGQTRAVASHNGNGRYSVRDGHFLHNGRATHWVTRCQ